jgi:hypothetical protein
MLRTNRFRVVTLLMAFAAHSSLGGPASADVYKESQRCAETRQCEVLKHGQCPEYRQSLDVDGIVCPGLNAPMKSTPSTGQYSGLVSNNAATSVSDKEYADRCLKAEQACYDGTYMCARWRDAFDAHGSVCPGVNAPPTAEMKGPTVISNAVLNTAATSGDTGDSPPQPSASDTLAKIQTECDAGHGYKTFGGQTKCVKDGIHGSPNLSAAAVSGELQLYMLIADNLVDKVERKQISSSEARVELQKAFLEFRDRTIQQLAETSAKQDAARLRAHQAEEIANAAQDREAQRNASLQAAEEVQNREAQRRQNDAIEFCVSEATQRIAANPQFRNDNTFTLGIYQVGDTYRNVDKFCANDKYWFKQVPPPRKFINCQNQGMLGVNCTEQ